MGGSTQMTVKNNRITITDAEVKNARLDTYKVSELEEALSLSGYELCINNK
jgi:hypothetical protein